MSEQSPLIDAEAGAVARPFRPVAARSEPKSPSLVRRSWIAVTAVAALAGSAVYISSSSSDQVATLEEAPAPADAQKAAPDTSIGITDTFSFDTVSLNLQIQPTAGSANSDDTTSVTLDAYGLPPNVIEYANTIATSITGNGLQLLTVTSSIANAGPAADPDADSPASRRRLDLPMSGKGTLHTRKQDQTAQCTNTFLDLSNSHFTYTCSLPHKASSEFTSALSNVYKGIFQAYKEVYGQISGGDASSQTASGEWEVNADGTDVTIKIHPYSEDSSQTFWSASATGTAADTAISTIQGIVEGFAALADPKLSMALESTTDPCTTTTNVKGSTTDLKCYVSFTSTVGIVGGFNVLMEAIPHMF